MQFGLGIKFPTGDYRYQDYFYRKEDSLVLAPVNPSIQLGDGGTGITTELNTYYIINKAMSLYGNLFYLINPREQNGVSPLLGRAPSSVDIKSGRFVNVFLTNIQHVQGLIIQRIRCLFQSVAGLKAFRFMI